LRESEGHFRLRVNGVRTMRSTCSTPMASSRVGCRSRAHQEVHRRRNRGSLRRQRGLINPQTVRRTDDPCDARHGGLRRDTTLDMGRDHPGVGHRLHRRVRCQYRAPRQRVLGRSVPLGAGAPVADSIDRDKRPMSA
jgi:hypothetical protein